MGYPDGSHRHRCYISPADFDGALPNLSILESSRDSVGPKACTSIFAIGQESMGIKQLGMYAAVLCVITMLRVDWDNEALMAEERLRVCPTCRNPTPSQVHGHMPLHPLCLTLHLA